MENSQDRQLLQLKYKSSKLQNHTKVFKNRFKNHTNIFENIINVHI